jgi:hypothetical protein
VTRLYSSETGDPALPPVWLGTESGDKNLLGEVVGECAIGKAQ